MVHLRMLLALLLALQQSPTCRHESVGCKSDLLICPNMHDPHPEAPPEGQQLGLGAGAPRLQRPQAGLQRAVVQGLQG